jgi:hypothetical protein
METSKRKESKDGPGGFPGNLVLSAKTISCGQNVDRNVDGTRLEPDNKIYKTLYDNKMQKRLFGPEARFVGLRKCLGGNL